MTTYTFLITGGGSGLGRDLCRYFAARGHSVLVTDIDADAARETVALLGAGVPATAHRLDVTREDDIRDFAASLGDQPVHVLVNNAGLQHVARLEEFPPDRWSWLIDVMLKGPALLTRAVLPRMRAQGYGRIVNIGSIHSLVASPFKSAYVAAKHGLLGLTKTIALEAADADITVNTICPSYIRTPLVEAQIAAQAQTHGVPEEEVLRRIMLEPMPKKAFVTSEEVAGTIEFLISSAARNITGQAIVIDGGWTAR
jgi:3-hydroxybutyrate dehydrogenase